MAPPRPSRADRRATERTKRPRTLRIPAFALAKTVTLAVFATIAAFWALHRAYTKPHGPLVVPVPDASDPGATEGGAREIPAPDLEIEPARPAPR